MLHSRNVTVEVNTVFENLQSVVSASTRPNSNSILSAFAQSVRGKGDRHRTGDHRRERRAARRVNPRMSTIRQDWRLFGKTAAAYSDAAQNILSILDSAMTTSTTITADRQALDSLLLSAIGFSQAGISVIGHNESNIVRSSTCSNPPRRCCRSTPRPTHAFSRARNGISTTAAETRSAETATR